MVKKYEYQFVLLDKKSFKNKSYHKIIQEQAHDGWRLIQLVPRYWTFLNDLVVDSYELIFEREIAF